MMTTIQNYFAWPLFVMAATSGICQATAIACPEIAKITQTCSEETGCTYQADALNGKQWTGENPVGRETDLASFVFREAYLFKNRSPKAVFCDYPGNNQVGIGARMALFIEPDVVTHGDAWQNETQPDGSILPRCVGPDPSRCTVQTMEPDQQQR